MGLPALLSAAANAAAAAGGTEAPGVRGKSIEAVGEERRRREELRADAEDGDFLGGFGRAVTDTRSTPFNLSDLRAACKPDELVYFLESALQKLVSWLIFARLGDFHL